jgi:hypothetical protein
MAVIRKPSGLKPYCMPNPSPNPSTHDSKARTYWLKVKRLRLGQVSNRSGVPRRRGMPQIRYPAYPGIFCARPECCISYVQHLLQRMEILRPCYSIIQRGLEGDLDNNAQRTERKEGSAEKRRVLVAEHAQVIQERDRESRHQLGETAMAQG